MNILSQEQQSVEKMMIRSQAIVKTFHETLYVTVLDHAINGIDIQIP